MRPGKLRVYQPPSQSSSPNFLRPGDVAITTGNCQPTTVSTVIGSLGELLRHIQSLAHKGCLLSFTLLSFPEDCARLKLSSARASQAGLKEMIIE